MRLLFAYINFLVIIVSVAGCNNGTVQENHSTDTELISSPYFGQEEPGNEPRIFMPGLISTYSRDGNIAALNDGKTFIYTNDYHGTRLIRLKDNAWTDPEIVPWSRKGGGLKDFTPGGRPGTFFFESSAPLNDSDQTNDKNIWEVEWTGEQWTSERPLPDIVNSEFDERYPSVTSDGTVYFFSKSRPDARGADLYCCRKKGDNYEPAERLPWPINSDYGELDFIVAPDDSFIIFGSDRPGGFGLCDNYIVFRNDDGEWSHPINMGEGLNSQGNEMRNSISSDGRFFFFGSTRATDVPKGNNVYSAWADRLGDSDVYWVSTKVIDALKKINTGKECAAAVIGGVYEESGLDKAIGEMFRLYEKQRNNYHFSYFEFLDLCSQMIAPGRADDADRFYAAMLRLFSDEFRVKLGYAQICTTNNRVSFGLSLIRQLAGEYPAFDAEQTMQFFVWHLYDHSQHEAALEVLNFKADMYPDSANAQFALAEYYNIHGAEDKALEYCRKTLEINPDYSFAGRLLEQIAP